MNSPGQETGAVVFPREQYEALESAVMESARGRWFLAEYARRNRAADTVMLLDALKKLENVASSTGIKSDKPLPDIDRLAETIKAARSEIASTHNDLLPDGGSLPITSGRVARQTHSSPPSSSIVSATERMTATVRLMRIRWSPSTIGASRKVSRIANASGTNTSCA